MVFAPSHPAHRGGREEAAEHSFRAGDFRVLRPTEHFLLGFQRRRRGQARTSPELPPAVQEQGDDHLRYLRRDC